MQSPIQNKINNMAYQYFVPLLIIWLLLAWLYSSLCCDSHSHDKKSSTYNSLSNSPNNTTDKNVSKLDRRLSTKKNVSAQPFTVNFSTDLKSDLIIKESEGFHFPEHDFVHVLPVSSELQTNVSIIKTYLNENPNQRLDIIGKYLEYEDNRSMFPDLGLARANDLKSVFVNQGISAKQIDTSSKVIKHADGDNGILYSMADFSIKHLTNNELIKEKNTSILLRERITNEPLVLRFEVGEAEINMSDQQRAKIKDIVDYVGKVKGAKVKVIGHTDSIGTDEANLVLGKERAEFAAKFLEDNGLDESLMEISSRGEQDAISNNSSPEARAKNRRTVITVN